MRHVMLDIETLGDGSNSVITSIGAVQFDIFTGKTYKEFHKYISIESGIRHGSKMYPSTVLWWMVQSDEARKKLVDGDKKGEHIVSILSMFRTWLNELKGEDGQIIGAKDLILWGRGPRFDMGILSDAYTITGLSIPWNFRNEMCVRTMEFLRPDIKYGTGKTDVGHGSEGMGTHDASLDAKYQIKYVSNIYRTVQPGAPVLNKDIMPLYTKQQNNE